MEMPNLHFWRIEKRKYQKLKNFILVAVILTDNQLLFYVQYRRSATQMGSCLPDDFSLPDKVKLPIKI